MFTTYLITLGLMMLGPTRLMYAFEKLTLAVGAVLWQVLVVLSKVADGFWWIMGKTVAPWLNPCWIIGHRDNTVLFWDSASMPEMTEVTHCDVCRRTKTSMVLGIPDQVQQ